MKQYPEGFSMGMIVFLKNTYAG
uniref:Uncharacterized protein n=1 Tax=Anguilla anguilla TaxID=7936 RepID=A0A0E9RQQ1_ANGAN